MNPEFKADKLVGLLLVGVGLFLWWKLWRTKNDLTSHLESERNSQMQGKVVNRSDNEALGTYPLSTIGDTPLAGVQFDPFNMDNPSAQPKDIRLYPYFMN